MVDEKVQEQEPEVQEQRRKVTQKGGNFPVELRFTLLNRIDKRVWIAYVGVFLVLGSAILGLSFIQPSKELTEADVLKIKKRFAKLELNKPKKEEPKKEKEDNILNNEEFVQNCAVTEAGLAELKKNLPYLRVDDFAKELCQIAPKFERHQTSLVPWQLTRQHNQCCNTKLSQHDLPRGRQHFLALFCLA